MAKIRMRKATAELTAAQTGIERRLAPWRAAFNRRPTAWILAGGFAGGIAYGLAAATRMGSNRRRRRQLCGIVARSVLTPMIAGALLARKQPSAPVTEPATCGGRLSFRRARNFAQWRSLKTTPEQTWHCRK
jgi:hypothetical protein